MAMTELVLLEGPHMRLVQLNIIKNLFPWVFPVESLWTLKRKLRSVFSTWRLLSPLFTLYTFRDVTCILINFLKTFQNIFDTSWFPFVSCHGVVQRCAISLHLYHPQYLLICWERDKKCTLEKNRDAYKNQTFYSRSTK